MAASYEARKFGVRSALPLATAHRRCPQMVLLPRDMEHYLEWSRRVMAIVREEVARVEVVGLDEAYLDLGDSDFPKSDCRRVKHRIKEETGLVCSIGLAPNKLLAKIASDLDKPDGFAVLTPETMLEAVGDRPASLIPGVGPKTFERLRRAGIKTVAELAGRRTSCSDGRASARSCAIARAESTTAASRPSASASRRAARRPSPRTSPTTTCWSRRSTAWRRGVCDGLQRNGYRGRTVTLKIRLRPFRTYTRSRTLEGADARTSQIGRRRRARAARPRRARRAGAAAGRRALRPGARGREVTPACSPRRRAG